MAHYLRPNERTRTPVRVICLDSESHVARDPKGSDHTFRLAVTSLDVRRATNRAKARTTWAEHTIPGELWAWVDAATTSSHATWLYAHHLEYDLTVTGAWDHLPALGWEMVARAAGGTAPWVRWRRGRHSLVCADLASWCRRKLSVIGDWLAVPKATMPAWEADDADWLAYCRRDVEVLRTAVLSLMDRVDTDDLGNWSLSGAGQAWRVFRHRFMADQILVHDDPVAQALERHAAFGGRREVYRVGTFDRVPTVDADFRAHYLVTAGRMNLPRRLAGVVEAPEADRVAGWMTTLSVIADVTVETEVPVAPMRSGAGILYPVGTFRTTLAGPELGLVEETGGRLTYHRAALYLSAPLLVPWARWCYEQLHGDDPLPEGLWRHVVKGMSRELIGKFGQRASALVRIGDHQPDRPPAETYYPANGRSAEQLVNRNDGLFLADRSQPGENAVPAIYAYVTSAARVALWRALETVGWPNVLACDTDGILASLDGFPGLLVHAPGGRLTGPGDAFEVGAPIRDPGLRHLPGELVAKRVYGKVEIRSPEAMILDGTPRVAGLPASASRTAEWEFQGETWPGADWQLAHRTGADYRTVVRPSVVRAYYRRRQVLPDGSTQPWRCSVVDGVNVIPELGLA